jgi:hypothetical protein
MGVRFQRNVQGDPASPKFTHIPDLKEQEITYEELPHFILSEFTKLTSGLLSNFALKALTIIRRNTHQLLSLFAKELDSAYLAHQALLPNIEDANELLVELFKDTLRDLLRFKNLNDFINKKLINKWIDEQIEEKELFLLNGDGTHNPDKKYLKSVDLVRNIVTSSNNNVQKRYEEEFDKEQSFIDYSKKLKEKHLKALLKNNLELFMPIGSQNNQDVNNQFAILTHHKSFFSPLSGMPILTLGTVIKAH